MTTQQRARLEAQWTRDERSLAAILMPWKRDADRAERADPGGAGGSPAVTRAGRTPGHE